MNFNLLLTWEIMILGTLPESFKLKYGFIFISKPPFIRPSVDSQYCHTFVGRVKLNASELFICIKGTSQNDERPNMFVVLWIYNWFHMTFGKTAVDKVLIDMQLPTGDYIFRRSRTMAPTFKKSFHYTCIIEYTKTVCQLLWK